jgi:O-antigen/teichoic acid export membrane protein
MSEIIRAGRLNAAINIGGAVLGLAANIVVVRAFGIGGYAEYATFLALIATAVHVLAAGGEAGFLNVLAEAEARRARLGLLLRLMALRCILGTASLLILVAGGPPAARAMGLPAEVWTAPLFALAGVSILAGLLGGLGYYGLLGIFRHARAQGIQEGLGLLRNIGIASIALDQPNLMLIGAVTTGIAVLEATLFLRAFIGAVRSENQDPGRGLVVLSLRHGAVNIFDKFTSLIGTVPFLLLVLGGAFSRPALAVISVANEATQRLLGLYSLPIGHMVLPYFSRAIATQGFVAAVRRIAALTTLLMVPIAGFAVVFFPAGVPLMYGDAFAHAGLLAVLIFLPAVIEGAARQCYGAALMTARRYRFVVRMNVAQLLASLGALAATLPYGLTATIAGQGAVRLGAAAVLVGAAWRAGWVPAPPVRLILATLAAAGFAWSVALWAPVGPPRAVVAVLLFGAGLFAAARALPLIDPPTQDILRAVLGSRLSRFFSRLLGASMKPARRTT